MIIYSGTKEQFRNDVINNMVAERIKDAFLDHGFGHGNDREYRAWENSLRCMNDVLTDDEIDDKCHVAIEYQIPMTAKRVDFLISGLDENNKGHVVIIELKQWESAERTSREDIVTTYLSGAIRATTHPSYQAYSYAKTIENFNETVENEKISLVPCAFLHNYSEEYRSELDNELYGPAIELAPIFLKRDFAKLRQFIKKYVRKPDNGELLYKIENGKIRPSKALQDTLGSMLHGNKEFYMIDEQKVAYETVRKLVKRRLSSVKYKEDKYTVIIQGGPGTGKSVIAVQLLVDLIKNGYNACYVTKNGQPREVYYRQLLGDKFKKNYIKNLFKSSGVFYDAQKDEFDCLIVDEAHRLCKKSAIFRGENQVKEIINAAKVSVFFIDESQIVTTKDIGTVEEIKKWAKALGSKVFEGEDYILKAQFRCNGSDGYMNFLDNLLGIRETANTSIDDLDYDFQIFDDPVAMREALRKKNEINNKARMVAGYCYEWISEGKPDSNLYDIVLENGFKAKWNFQSKEPWAIDKNSFEQVGCIHTSQGLEFDYVGVIIGLDLRYEDGRIITDQRQAAYSDKSSGVRGCKDVAKADKIIRDTYKVLMSRGQKGCYVYCEDKALATYMRKILFK